MLSSQSTVARRIFVGFTLLAILLHIAALYTFRYVRWDSLSPGQVLPSQIVELFDDKRPIVRSEESDDQSDDKAEFRSDRRNRVKEQTKSPRLGAYQQGGRLTPQPESTEEGEGDPAPRLKLSDLLSLSQSPYDLDDKIRDGDDTVLNTDGIAYASFLNRISDSIYPTWVRHLKEATEQLGGPESKGSAIGSEFITRLGVEMDTSGNIVSMQILKSSGVPGFDDAPKSAFWDHEPFRNPPMQMFASNENTVRFVYEFHFQWKKSFFSILPSIPL